MKTFDVTLAGYNALTSGTDDLVKWVWAPSMEAIQKWIDRCHVPLHGAPFQMEDHQWEDGVDLELNDQGEVIRGHIEIYDVFSPWYRNHYECPCGCKWQDEWNCTCNDRCPDCDSECNPVYSEDLTAATNSRPPISSAP